MTDIDLTPATEAAAVAVRGSREYFAAGFGVPSLARDQHHFGGDGHPGITRVAVEAATPLIAAAVLDMVADKIGPYTPADPAITDPATGDYVTGGSMAIQLSEDGEDASLVRGYLRHLAAQYRKETTSA
ncbi:hypothetical protein [Kocuria rosea]|uniref:hypothetical protein n=1 Tax=Kocuria rosea TaxID=1275 RepID=UPI003D32E957